MLNKVMVAALVGAAIQAIRAIWPDLSVPAGFAPMIADLIWILLTAFGVATAAWKMPESAAKISRLETWLWVREQSTSWSSFAIAPLKNKR